MNDEAQNVPDDAQALEETPLTSTPATPAAETTSPAMESASNGISTEPTPVTEPVTSDVAQDPESEALQEQAVAQDDSAAVIGAAVVSDAVGEVQDAPAIEVSAVADEVVPETAAEAPITRTEIEDPRAVAQSIAPEATDEPAADEPAADEPAADEPPAEMPMDETPVTEAVVEAEPAAVEVPADVGEVAAEPINSEAGELVSEQTADVDAAEAEPSGAIDTAEDEAVEPSTEVVDDNFILEKVAEAKAAKKKKVAAPRVRKPPKRGKQKLPDLGDGSGYEPPDTGSAVVAENADGSPSTVEVEEEALWYALHCYSGYENKVKHSLEQRIETMGMAGRILEVVVPTEEEIEVRDGKRKTVERRVFPGYVLVRMRMSEDSWHVVRNTPGVTRFIGMGNRPQPLSPQEVNQILRRMEAEAPKIKVSFKVGQKVRITDGPFADFMGLVDKIDTERAKVAVLVSFFGRETPVELDFLQVEKM